MKSFESGCLERDIDKIRQLSGLVKKRILESNPKYERKIDNLTGEELEDFDNLLCMAEQILIKYQQKKDTYGLLKEFTEMIKDWSCSLVGINDAIQELIISAQCSVSEIKTAQDDVSVNLSFDGRRKQQAQTANSGTINLTKSAIPVYTPEYLQNSQAHYEQVV
jgi:hypothetical protein